MKKLICLLLACSVFLAGCSNEVVSDEPLQDSETITITVNNMNNPPVLATISNKSISENDTLSFEILRDSSGNNSGGLFTSSTTLVGWNDSPSARIVINRFI